MMLMEFLTDILLIFWYCFLRLLHKHYVCVEKELVLSDFIYFAHTYFAYIAEKKK